jgi:3-deoxy-D-manno-octulosonic-acid transferase
MIFRIVSGKEDVLRIPERLGIPSIIKSSKRIIWIHAASVGESKIALTLTKHLQKIHKKHKILVTTGTVSSSVLIRKNLNGSMMHQLIPLDNYISIWLFFKYWRPDIVIIFLCELWPYLFHIGSKNFPLLLANARMSDKSYERWKRYNFVLTPVINKFKAILCQSSKDHSKYASLKASNSIVVGNLKYSASKLPVPPHKLRVLNAQIKRRKVFLAASTHPGDEKFALEVHNLLAKKYPEILTIIAPRHIDRVDEIKKLFEQKKLKVATRSTKDKISDKTNIYIADTMGELGLWFSIADVTFLAGSFKQGGHNLIEPAYFDTVLTFGPNMSNCQEVAEEFLDVGAAYQIKKAKDLYDIADKVYSGEIKNNPKKSAKIIQNHMNIIDNYIAHVSKYLQE